MSTWIDTYPYRWPDIAVQPGETWQGFHDRCTPALKVLDSAMTDEEACEYLCDAWNNFVLEYATQVTLTLEKPVDEYTPYDVRWLDWKVKEIHAATMPNVSFSSVEKAKAATGDTFKIRKSTEEKQLVFGWANIAKDVNGNYPLDWDGDFTDPADLENAAYTFVLKYRATGENHQGEAVGQLVESVMLTKEKQEALGIPDGLVPEGWWVGFHIPDAEIFKKIKSGEYEMFSVEGSAKRVPAGQ